MNAVAREPDGLLGRGQRPRGDAGLRRRSVASRPSRAHADLLWDDPFVLRDAMAGRSGLELMRMMVAGEVSPPPIAETLGFRLSTPTHGRACSSASRRVPLQPDRGRPRGARDDSHGLGHGLAFVTTLDEPTGWTDAGGPASRGPSPSRRVCHCVGTVVHPAHASRRPRPASRTPQASSVPTGRARSSCSARVRLPEACCATRKGPFVPCTPAADGAR